ncbi:MAG: hypothetical protein ACR2OZ_17890 [Verrucomicrobiales bacterium]
MSWSVVCAQERGTEGMGRHVWQPVQEYFTNADSGGTRFIGYTHLGTDFGNVGAADAITAGSGEAIVEVPVGSWAGMWHSLGGLARDKNTSLDFQCCHPAWIQGRWQAHIVGLKIRARGNGTLKVELKSAANSTLWTRRFSLRTETFTDFTAALEPADLRSVKFLNWIAESGTQARIDGVWLEVELPPVDFDEQVFAASYAKLSRCYSPESGLVRDRAHAGSGVFDSVPATGMFCLASAVAAQTKLVEKSFAREVLRRAHSAVAPTASRLGLLPHFLEKTAGGSRIAPGTEFSTVDSAIYLHSVRLAARILGDEESGAAIQRALRRIDFSALRDAEGFIIHGTLDDGVTRLGHTWRDWGGESALVLLLARLAEGDEGVLRMHTDGRVFGGVGFIAELQSLFFPHFSHDRPDGLTKVNWRLVRTNMFEMQKRYFAEHFPQSTAAQIGAFGLSAGEGAAGIGYAVSGVEMADRTLIHPHYMLMSAALEPDPGEVYRRLWQMEDAGWFTPWGLVENIDVINDTYLPMNGALNAAFEALGAYHVLVKNRGEQNVIYTASNDSVDLAPALAQRVIAN